MEYKKYMKIIAIILISILFVYSGIHKIFDFNDTTLSFHQKINNGFFGNMFRWDISQGLIIIAILILICAPALMLYGVVYKNDLLLKIGAWLLIIFTVLATIIYHPITNPAEINNMLKNLTIIGGLIMVSLSE
jgi:uncharacterized membrane protein YphA (DoxX/SURF4 family)